MMSTASSMNTVKDSAAVLLLCRSSGSLNSDSGVVKFSEGAGDGPYEVAGELCISSTFEAERTCMAPGEVYSGADDDGEVYP